MASRFLVPSDLETPMSGRLLDRGEAAERLHVSEKTVRRLGRAGHLEEIRVSERAVRITEDSLERHLAERRIRHGSEAVTTPQPAEWAS